MITRNGNKTWYKAVKSFYKLGKKGRISHVVAAMAACLTITAAGRAADVTVTTPVTDTVVVAADGDTVVVSDSGSVTHTNAADNAIGIDLTSSGVDENFTITNLGTISATSVNDYAYGIRSWSLSSGSTITNSGTIAVSSPSRAYGIYLGEMKDTSSIENSGIITVSSDQRASGIYMDGNAADTCFMSGTSSIINSGTISVTSSTEWASGIIFQAVGDASVVNSGTISVTSSTGYYTTGIWARFIVGNASITNTGTIEATSEGTYTTGIRVDFSTATTSVINSGTISLTSDSSSATLKGVSITGSASFTNTGTVQALDSTGAMANDYFSVYTQGSVTNSGTLIGEYYAADTVNSGLIQMPAVSNTISGDLTQTESGTIGITLYSDDDAANTQFTTLAVSGATTLADGSGIYVDVTTALNYQSLLVGQTLTGVLTSTSGITADTSALNVTDNSILLDFVPVLSSGDTSLDLTVEQGMTILEAVTAGGGSGVGGAADTLDSLLLTTDSEISTFIGDLITLSSEAAVAAAVAQAAPVTSAQTPALSTQVTNTMSSVVQARQQSVRGFNSGDGLFTDRNLWVKPYWASMDQDDVDGVCGFSAQMWGMGMGTDGELSQDNRLGLALFFTRVDSKTNNTPQESDLDVFNLMVYGSRPLAGPNTNIFFQAGTALQDTESRREIESINAVATADYTANSLFAQAKATRTYQPLPHLKLLPGASFSYTWFYTPSYDESGAGGMNLFVNSFDTHSLVAALETDLIWTLEKDCEIMANLSLGYDLVDDDTIVASTFQGGGTVFETQGIDNSPVVWGIGLGTARKFTDRFSLDAKYDLTGQGSDFTTHMLSAKFNWKF